MAIDSMMALRGQVPDLGQAVGSGLQNASSLMALRENQQMKGARQQQALSDMEMSKIKSYGIASAAMLPMLESGDTEGVVNFLNKRKSQLDELGLDSADTVEAIQLAQTNPELLKSRSLQAVDLYNQFNQGPGAEEPSQVREYKYWRSLDDKGKKDFIDVKRSGFDSGGVQYTGSGRQIIQTDKIASDKAKLAGAEAAGKAGIEASGEAIKTLTGTRKNIASIDDAINAIDKGAKSGAIQSFFPSITAASVELDNARGKMGLDLVGATTFGALSKGELDFALDTAVPMNLNEKDLKVWLVRKKSAQQKLAQELENAAIYLGKPGNTPAGYLEFQRNKPAAPDIDSLLNKYAP